MITAIRKNKLYAIALGALIIGVLLCLYYLYVLCEDVDAITVDGVSKFIAKQLKSNFGDFITGTVGVLFTLTTTFFLFITFREQRKQFDLSNNDQKQARFETTYFNLLGMLDDVRLNVNTNMKLNITTHNINNLFDYYQLFKNFYNNQTQNGDFKFLADFPENNTDIVKSEIEKAEGCIEDLFNSFIKEYKCNIGYYFRYIYNTINFVINERETEDIPRYLNILMAQLSNEEMALIFYDALSKYGRDKNGFKLFKQNLDKYEVLENIDVDYLLKREHYFFYPNTKFKFLNRDELNVIINRN